MAIRVACQCGGQFAAPDNLAGQQAQCPQCGAALTVPGPSSGAATGAASSAQIPVQCRCGAQFRAPATMAGQTTSCPTCRQSLTIGGASSPAAPPTVTPSTATTQTGIGQCGHCGGRFQASAAMIGQRVACPNCQQPMQVAAAPPPNAAPASSFGLMDSSAPTQSSNPWGDDPWTDELQLAPESPTLPPQGTSAGATSPTIVPTSRRLGHRCPKCNRDGPIGLYAGHYCASIVVMTFWGTKPIVGCRVCGGIHMTLYTLSTLVFGWWGFPFGLIMTPVQLVRNLGVIISGPQRP